MNAQKENAKILRSVNSVFQSVVEQLFAQRALREEDLHDPEKLIKKIVNIAEHSDFYPVFDHTDSLSKIAASFAESGDLDVSIMFYATYFEHALNNIIDQVLRSRGVSEKAKYELIRSVNIPGKCGWMLEVLQLPKFNSTHKSVIVNLSNERNAFVHYKWTVSIDDSLSAKEKKKAMINSAKKTATYLKRYTTRLFLCGKKSALAKALTIE